VCSSDLVAITACVMSYVIWNFLRVLSGNRLSPMTILENNCMQSTASAAGASTGATIATAFGALLLLTGEHMPWKIVMPFTLLTACLGVFLAIPMKRQMINVEQLKFPSGVLAAATLRSLHGRGKEALRKAYALMVSILAGAVVGFFNTGSTGGVLKWMDKIVEPLNIPGLLPPRGFVQVRGRSLQGLGFDPSVLLIAAGMIVGLRVSLSMLGASALLYFVIGPQLAALDAAHAGQAGYIASLTLTGDGSTFRITQWSLWGGTSLMVFSSLTAVALQWRTIARSFRVLRGGQAAHRAGGATAALEAIEVPTSWLIGGLIPIGIALLALQIIAFHINVWLGLIAIGMSFILSLVASRSTGETDTTPVGAMGKVMQLLFAVLSPGNVQHNLMSAGVAANSASSSADLLTDLKSGYLLGAKPRQQFLAQFIGVFFGVAAIVPAWYLMVPNQAALEKFNPPATLMWLAVARALTQGLNYIPISARWAIVGGGLIGILLPVLARVFPKAARYLPSAMGLGLGWVVWFTNSLAFAGGAVIVWLWERVSRRSAEAYVPPVASGLVAGESLMKAVIAIMSTVVGLSAAKSAHP